MATHTVLCTGAYTPKLLEYSAASSGLTDLRAGSRIVAGGITTGMTKLDDESYKRFASMPVGVQGYTAATGDLPFPPLRYLTCQLTLNARPVHRQPASDSRQGAQVVGADDFQKHPRGTPWSFSLSTTSGTGLWAVGCLSKAQGGHRPRQQGLLWQEWCKLGDGETSHLLVSHFVAPNVHDADRF